MKNKNPLKIKNLKESILIFNFSKKREEFKNNKNQHKVNFKTKFFSFLYKSKYKNCFLGISLTSMVMSFFLFLKPENIKLFDILLFKFNKNNSEISNIVTGATDILSDIGFHMFSTFFVMILIALISISCIIILKFLFRHNIKNFINEFNNKKENFNSIFKNNPAFNIILEEEIFFKNEQGLKEIDSFFKKMTHDEIIFINSLTKKEYINMFKFDELDEPFIYHDYVLKSITDYIINHFDNLKKDDINLYKKEINEILNSFTKKINNLKEKEQNELLKNILLIKEKMNAIDNQSIELKTDINLNNNFLQQKEFIRF